MLNFPTDAAPLFLKKQTPLLIWYFQRFRPRFAKGPSDEVNWLILLSLQIVVNSLVHAVPAIVNVMLVCLIFWLIFSIVGYQLFGGKFYKCVNETTMERYDYTVVENKSMCNESAGMRWLNSKINFDSSLQGFLALFQVVRIKYPFPIQPKLICLCYFLTAKGVILYIAKWPFLYIVTQNSLKGEAFRPKWLAGIEEAGVLSPPPRLWAGVFAFRIHYS